MRNEDGIIKRTEEIGIDCEDEPRATSREGHNWSPYM